nr:PREDICTED: protein yellow-like isoform X2 [Bemisia tabaci]
MHLKKRNKCVEKKLKMSLPGNPFFRKKKYCDLTRRLETICADFQNRPMDEFLRGIAQTCRSILLSHSVAQPIFQYSRHKTHKDQLMEHGTKKGTAAKNMTSPKLIPYPDEAVHRLSAKKMTSIISIRVDPCGRLWALDTGEVAGKRETPPAIHVIDLKMNVIIRSHLFKEREDYDTDSQLSTIAVDVTSSNCEDAYAYVTDYVRYMLIIYSWRNDASYRETHNFFHFDPLFGFIINNGRHIHVRHGIYSLATSPVDRDGYRRLYFSAYASTMQFIISTKILQNKTFNYERPMYEFKVMGSRGPRGQSSAASLDEETGILFYTLIAKNALGCWNSFRGEEFSEKTQGIIVQDDTELSYPNDVRVDKTGILWLLVNNYIAYQLNQLEADSFNFKIFKGKVRQIIRGSVCEEV